MSAIPAKALREKTSQELQDQLMLEKKRLFDAVVKGASGETIKPHEKREGKRLIARIRSILRERELRQELDKTITDLAPKAKDAAPTAAKWIKRADERNAEIKAELAKPRENRKVKPQLGRIRTRNIECVTAADRAAVRLAEAKRRRASIDREDVGQTR
ncbi:MAG TPA: 50S ribosomal protein L29 [Planctomycetota bacterium]|nr:50S ribosomal protein L29 [Planctomycetota bacterium]